MAGRLSGAILAAGQGQRLRPASAGLAKPLVNVGGQSLLLRQIDLMHRAGVTQIHVIINSETHRLMHELEVVVPEGVDLMVRDTPNSMESLLSLGERMTSGFFLLMTVDTILFPSDVRSFVTMATKIVATVPSRLDGALGVVKWVGDANPLFVEIASDGLITALGEFESTIVTAGIYLLSTAVFVQAAEARARRLNAMRRFLGMLIEKGMRFTALEISQAIDIDDAASLRAAQEMIARES
jgi:glucose-1-phosphate thymidylyltransferase